MPLMIVSVFGILGSVKRRNFVPVSVWNTVRRKKLLSIVSMPVAGTLGSGNAQSEARAGFALGCIGSFGVMDLVMACTPWKVPARTR